MPLGPAPVGALTSFFVVLGAMPAGAVITEPVALTKGCAQKKDRSVVCTFTRASGGAITVDVPDGVTTARLSVRGGAGGRGLFESDSLVPSGTNAGGSGGTASITLPVDAAKDLLVIVGAAGQSGADGGAGGDGAGPGGRGSVGVFAGSMVVRGGGGGGASEVRVAGAAEPLVVAGGGGGGGSGLPLNGLLPFPVGPGGIGGGVNGAPGPSVNVGNGQAIAGGGAGGSQTAGGTGGAFVLGVPAGVVGATGTRGAGGDAAPEVPGLFAGGTGAGGGGGGYYGGGGGSAFAGGGGGSGFGPPDTRYGSGPNTPTSFVAAALSDGEVVIEFAPPPKT